NTPSATATPPLPPAPAVRRAVVRLAASPVVPETESADDWAPELALESADPRAEASPVGPDSPESPELASPARVVLPFRAELAPVRLTRAGPVSPLGPDSPDAAEGSEMALEEA